MRRLRLFLLAVPLVAGACLGGYTRAEFIWGEPAPYVYVVDVDRVVVVSREVLVHQGYVVYRVERAGPRRIIWARRGDDQMVRIFVTPDGNRVLIRGLEERRDRGRHRGWVRHGKADGVLVDIDVRLRAG